MTRITKLTVFISIVLCFSCFAQYKAMNDTSSHALRFVLVEKNVKLEVLDWGGSGRPVVLLAGGGNTAHVFDDFAQKLKKHFHVYGITRRGFGQSQFSPLEDKNTLGKDILAVLDSMHIHKPVLAGHSIAGAELSAIARMAPDRVSALIYMEAGYPYAFNNEKSPSMDAFSQIKGPQHPSPEEKDLTSYKALQNWNTRTYGFQIPLEELLHTWDSTDDGRPTHRRDNPGFAAFPLLLNDSGKHDTIPVSSLVIFAIPHTKETWILHSKDEKVKSEGTAYFTKIDSLTKMQANAVETGVPSAQIARLAGMHYIFISNEREVINLFRRFIY